MLTRSVEVLDGLTAEPGMHSDVIALSFDESHIEDATGYVGLDRREAERLRDALNEALGS